MQQQMRRLRRKMVPCFEATDFCEVEGKMWSKIDTDPDLNKVWVANWHRCYCPNHKRGRSQWRRSRWFSANTYSGWSGTKVNTNSEMAGNTSHWFSLNHSDSQFSSVCQCLRLIMNTIMYDSICNICPRHEQALWKYGHFSYNRNFPVGIHCKWAFSMSFSHWEDPIQMAINTIKNFSSER